MLTDPQNPLHSEVLNRRYSLKERVLNLMRNPETILDQQDILFVERYDDFISIFLYSPSKERKYQTVPIGCSLGVESRHLLFCYERTWETEGYNDSAPVIEIKDGRQVECGILNLENSEETERVALEDGFNQIQRIIAGKDATIKE